MRTRHILRTAGITLLSASIFACKTDEAEQRSQEASVVRKAQPTMEEVMSAARRHLAAIGYSLDDSQMEEDVGMRWWGAFLTSRSGWDWIKNRDEINRIVINGNYAVVRVSPISKRVFDGSALVIVDRTDLSKVAVIRL